jgi:hypothetical protein
VPGKPDIATEIFELEGEPYMKQLTTLGVVCLSLVSVAYASDDKCKDVNGQAVSTTIPAPNDPLGRSLGSSSGSLKGAVSGYLTSLTPQADGTIQVTSFEVFALGPQELLIFTCKTVGTPVAGVPVGTVNFSSIYTVVGGTGKYVAASGALKVTGTILNAFGPNAGPGNTYSESTYTGRICQSK